MQGQKQLKNVWPRMSNCMKRFGQFSHLINFVYLAKNSYSPNTAKSYIAAIGFKNENEFGE
jgi:hypothetical protein